MVEAVCRWTPSDTREPQIKGRAPLLRGAFSVRKEDCVVSSRVFNCSVSSLPAQPWLEAHSCAVVLKWSCSEVCFPMCLHVSFLWISSILGQPQWLPHSLVKFSFIGILSLGREKGYYECHGRRVSQSTQDQNQGLFCWDSPPKAVISGTVSLWSKQQIDQIFHLLTHCLVRHCPNCFVSLFFKTLPKLFFCVQTHCSNCFLRLFLS